MEGQAFTLKDTANYRKEDEGIKQTLQPKIEKIQDSLGVDDAGRLGNLKSCFDDLERQEQEDTALKLLAKYKLD